MGSSDQQPCLRMTNSSAPKDPRAPPSHVSNQVPYPHPQEIGQELATPLLISSRLPSRAVCLFLCSP